MAVSVVQTLHGESSLFLPIYRIFIFQFSFFFLSVFRFSLRMARAILSDLCVCVCVYLAGQEPFL